MEHDDQPRIDFDPDRMQAVLDGDLEPSRSGDGFAMTLRLPLRHTHAEVSPRA